MPRSGHRRTTAASGRGPALLGLVAAVLVLVTTTYLLWGERTAAAQVGPALPVRPNFVVIQTDDSTLEQLYAAWQPYPGAPAIRAMPNTLDLIAKQGATFDRYYVSYPLCAPSRASLWTGRYAHNEDKGNVQPDGGYSGFRASPGWNHNIATWLQGDGYRTIHIGKFLNGYGEAPYSSYQEVPPGWSSWNSVINSDSDHFYYGYELSHNGVLEGPFGNSGSWETREYGERDDPGCPTAPTNGKPCYYETDKFDELAVRELEATPPGQPFYLQLDEAAPHGDFRRPAGPEPPPRYYTLFDGAPLPDSRHQGFDQGNVNGMPRFIRAAPYLSAEEIHTYRVYYDKALESLRGVDDGVKTIIDELGALHELRDTYIMFTSDNGFFYGQHRLVGGKFLAYEPSTHLPFLIRGPGIKPGTESDELASNIDIAPTILELAHVRADHPIDGRSLFPFARDPSLITRRPVLFESFVETADVEEDGGLVQSARTHAPAAHASILAPPKNYYGIVLGPYKYIEWPDGEKELYDLETDPYELRNIVRDPNFFPVRAFLHRELERLETCSGKACSEESPPLPLTRREQAQLRHEHEREQREREREKERREGRHGHR
ncbi:MAG: sulfatase [Actinobacteria bacterium]|nr:sulfatase [Actinomycetota bacterium]